MTPSVLTLILLAQATAPPSIELQKRGFLISRNGKSDWVVFDSARPKTWSLHENGHWFVWDERGFTVRGGDQVRSTRFPDLPTSPKLFSGSELLGVIQELEAGNRSRNASALSGYALIGSTLYLLVRWDDFKSRPWLETLLAIDTKSDEPWPKFVAKLPGLTAARGNVSEELLVRNNSLIAGIREKEGWGLWSMAPNQQPVYKRLGGVAVNHQYDPATGQAVIVEKTSYGAYTAAVWSGATGGKVIRAETVQPMRVVSVDPPLVAEAGKTSASLRNLATGALWRYPAGSEVRATPLGVLAWNPGDVPARAVLLTRELVPICKWSPPNKSEPIP